MMLTGKALFHSLLTELNEMGLPGMSATLDEMYRSPGFPELDPLMAIAGLVERFFRKYPFSAFKHCHAYSIIIVVFLQEIIR